MLAKFEHFSLYWKHKFIPISKEIKNGEVSITCFAENVNVKSFLEKHYEAKITINNCKNIAIILNETFKNEIMNHSTNNLLRQKPEKSAANLIKHPKLIFSILCMMVLMVISSHSILTYVLFLMNFIYMIFNIFKLTLFSKAFIKINKDKETNSLNEQWPENFNWPKYTILLPLHDEKNPKVIDNVQKINYPHEKLDVKIIIEENDDVTKNSVYTKKLPSYFHIIEIPDSLPKTKPKACNYAMFFAEGTLTTIYDAEDAPDVMQLKKAAYLFSKLPKEYVCLQAKLNFSNNNDNLLTKFFSIEYFSWFNYMLKGLEFFEMPVPLGGTSNHFKTEILQKLLLWDPHNVTEDADLGLRIATEEYRTSSFNSSTMEEAPTSVKVWINQRSRWIKGYMQTYLVHMRHPVSFFKKTGWRGFLSLQCFIGFSALSFVLSPIIILAGILTFFDIIIIEKSSIYQLSFIFNAILFFTIPFLLCHLINHHQSNLTKKKDIVTFMIFPFYYLLHSIASIKATWELFFRPYYWDKTPHD